MAYTYKNITGNTAAILLNVNTLSNRPIKEMTVCNIHASENVNLDLYLSKTTITDLPDSNNWTPMEKTNKYFIVKDLLVSHGTTVKFEKDDFLIDYKFTEYDLYIKLSESDSAVDVIINN